MDLFNDYIEQASEMESTFEDKITVQNNMMRSDLFNKNFEYIESMLNRLYEKTRILQNISEYTRTFLQTQVVSRKAELYELLKEAETTRDSIKRYGYKKRTVLFAEDLTAKKTDRDGIEIAPTSVLGGKVTLLGKEEEFVPIKSLTVERSLPLSIGNEKDILQGKPSRSLYFLDGPASNGVSEVFRLELEKESYITLINAESVNSDIVSINIIDGSNKKIQVTEQAKTGFKKQLATAVEVTISDKDYRQVAYEYDAQRMSKDFWRQASERQYAEEIGSKSIAVLESESGVEQYRKDYEAYIKNLAAWEAEKAAVAERNALKKTAYETAYESWKLDTDGKQKAYESELALWRQDTVKKYNTYINRGGTKSEMIESLISNGQ